jgi:hypothetical protein
MLADGLRSESDGDPSDRSGPRIVLEDQKCDAEAGRQTGKRYRDALDRFQSNYRNGRGDGSRVPVRAGRSWLQEAAFVGTCRIEIAALLTKSAYGRLSRVHLLLSRVSRPANRVR